MNQYPAAGVHTGPHEPLAGRRVLVTGGSSGIGAASARALAAAGARVAVLARRRAVLAEVAGPIGAAVVPADVTDPAAARAAVDAAASELGGLDAVVGAAGIARPAPFEAADPADWRAMFESNVLGLLHVCQAAIGHLRAAGGGDLVHVSSMSGRRIGSVEMAVYAASKAAVHHVSEGLRRAYAPEGIRVSVLAPGFVSTGIFDGQDDPVGRRYGERARAVGLPVDEVAGAVVRILAAPASVGYVEVAMLSLEQG